VALPRAAQYGLRVVPLDEPWAERAFALCFRGAGALTPAAQLLLDHLQRCGADGPWHPADGQAPNRP
jgi:DNA-binding transcriptional LysR family regulator